MINIEPVSGTIQKAKRGAKKKPGSISGIIRSEISRATEGGIDSFVIKYTDESPSSIRTLIYRQARDSGILVRTMVSADCVIVFMS